RSMAPAGSTGDMHRHSGIANRMQWPGHVADAIFLHLFFRHAIAKTPPAVVGKVIDGFEGNMTKGRKLPFTFASSYRYWQTISRVTHLIPLWTEARIVMEGKASDIEVSDKNKLFRGRNTTRSGFVPELTFLVVVPVRCPWIHV